MNSRVGRPKLPAAKYWSYVKTTEMIHPGPSGIFVLTDERADSINNCIFGVDMTGYDPASPDNPSAGLIDWPGFYHKGAGTFQFADGHVESHKWQDPRTTPPLERSSFDVWYFSMPNNPDLWWIQAHAAGLVED